ncbi:precorrin-6Y C5,15-methyltransferase (decarboxylating) [Paracoccus solventivorans]|uniref:Precorrin-6Y C5,15-methyltransferase (Decarboxylating) n=1 Tax=Paracoccus solventivorans TaxID=53463 RepID=A0A1M7GZY5_9RHOB|nr:precorrin-6y C5,15-methyltransferase (decarboxylating) subunit CbiE [Paracoccus solventivorans]SHM21962.1 precorrin-6Y C5,15-methyltransferase (decarboxylating) [Paracoccus solventivorans]
MSDPWLSIIGLGEDGLSGLSPASRAALDAAEIVFGGPRHLRLAQAGQRGRAWPVPFDLAPVLACRGQRVAVLASGDPFWHGAGGSLAAQLAPGEWRAFPAPSSFSLAASRLGWRIEDTACLGLHAAPFERLLPVLRPGARAILLLRDGQAPAALAAWLAARGWGASTLWVMEALGGPRERIRQATAAGFELHLTRPPVAVALQAAGGVARRAGPGLPDDAFQHDGQITRAPVRALTLAALAPQAGALLWDLGAGSGSVAVEWALAGGRAVAVERRADRFGNIIANIKGFGLSEAVTTLHSDSIAALPGLPDPDAVFVGGGLTEALAAALWARIPPGTTLVANAVTLETEALLAGLHHHHGGTMLRIELAEAAPLGGFRGWQPARPVVQWAVTR